MFPERKLSEEMCHKDNIRQGENVRKPPWPLYGNHMPTTRTLCDSHTSTTGTLSGTHTSTTRTLCGSHTPTTRTLCGRHMPTTRTLCGTHTPTTRTLCGTLTLTTRTLWSTQVPYFLLSIWKLLEFWNYPLQALRFQTCRPEVLQAWKHSPSKQKQNGFPAS